MAKRFAAGAAAAALAFSAGAASAACDLRLVEQPKPLRVIHDSFDLTPTIGSTRITLENRANSPCELGVDLEDAIGAAPPFAAPQAGASIDVAVSGQSAGPGDVGAFAATIPAADVAEIVLDGAVVDRQVVEAGDYAQSFGVILFDRATGLAPIGFAEPIEMQLLLESPPRAQVNIAGAAASFGEGLAVDRVDFGALVEGASRRVFVQVRANTGATLSVTSENGGVLRHVSVPDAVAPYSARLDDRTLDLSITDQVAVDPPRTVAGRSLPMDMTIGRIERPVAGRYEDIVTIEIIPE